jgi:hypothetical protein
VSKQLEELETSNATNEVSFTVMVPQFNLLRCMDVDRRWRRKEV